MLLKRFYRKPEGWVKQVDDAGNCINRPPVSHVQVIRAKRLQRFSPNVIEGGVAEGWLSMAKGCITIHAENGTWVYRIIRTPGKYPLPGSLSGYEVTHSYDCILEEGEYRG